MYLLGGEIWRVALAKETSFPHSEQTSPIECVYLRLDSNNGLKGFGCATPTARSTTETIATVSYELTRVLDLLKSEKAKALPELLELAHANLIASPVAAAAIDIAMYDLLAKEAKLPAWKLLGGNQNRIPTAGTIPFLSLHSTIRQAQALHKQGFQTLRIVGGGSWEEEAERVIKVREKLGAIPTLIFDAEEGFSFEDTLKFSESVLPHEVFCIEQPLPREKKQELVEVASQCVIPIMLDEGLRTLSDAHFFKAENRLPLFNIKLMQVGGIAPALSLVLAAQIEGVDLYVSGLEESQLGISAALHFALGSPMIHSTCLDGFMTLSDDPAKGILRFEEGYLYPNEKPGFGFEG